MKKILFFILFVLLFLGTCAFKFPEKSSQRIIPVVTRVSQNKVPQPLNKISFLGGIFILTLLTYGIWFKYGKDDIVIPEVNFYPPKNINPVEAEFAYKGRATKKGIAAFILYLAGKGCLKIKDEGETFTIERVENFGVNLSASEKDFMKSLFPFDYDFVTKEELQTSYIFHDRSEKMINYLNNHKEIIFFKESVDLSLYAFMILCTLVVIILSAFYHFYYGFWWFTILYNLTCIIISGVCTYQLPKRNSVGLRLLGKLLGLKKFIEVAQKHELEMFVEKNPHYFYDILPFAYILDVSNKWIDKFENISVIDPNWESGHNFYSMSNLGVINAFLDVLNSNVTL